MDKDCTMLLKWVQPGSRSTIGRVPWGLVAAPAKQGALVKLAPQLLVRAPSLLHGVGLEFSFSSREQTFPFIPHSSDSTVSPLCASSFTFGLCEIVGVKSLSQRRICTGGHHLPYLAELSYSLTPWAKGHSGLAAFGSGGHSLLSCWCGRSTMTHVKVVKMETLGRSPLEGTLQIIVI